MKYILKTEVNENGNLVFSKKRVGKDYIYLAKDENGNIGQVLKSWIIQHQNEIENVRVSGDSIYAVDKKKKIEDFGEKIGGAKKDLASKRSITLADLEGMSVQEKDKYLRKDKLWPKVNVEEMVAQGYDKIILNYVEGFRALLPAKPRYSSNSVDMAAASQSAFESLITSMRDICYKYKDYSDTPDMQNELWQNFFDIGLLEKRNHSNLITLTGNLYMNKKYGRYLSKGVFDVIEEAAEKPNYMTPDEKIAARLCPIRLEGYKLVCVENDGRLTFSKYVRNGNITTYQYLYSKMKILKTFLEANSLGTDVDSINRLLAQNSLWGLLYLGISKNEVLLFTLSKDDCMDWLENHMDIFFTYEEKMDKAQAERDRKIAEIENEEATNRKKRLTASNLETVERTGPTVRNKDIVGQDFIDTFGIRGGEFGNWVNEAERQLNMNMCFDSFRDLATVLGIPNSAVGLNHKLNIAFGARGNGNAAAHYEPAREVINLTKMRGAGSLAHEYFHAIDDMCGKALGKIKSATELADEGESVPVEFNDLLFAMKYKYIKVSAEEAKQEKIHYYERQVEQVKGDMDKFLPDSTLTDDVKREKYRITEDLLKKARDGVVFIDLLDYKINPVLKEVFSLINKYSKTYTMSKNNQRYFANNLNFVGSSYADTLKEAKAYEFKTKTDYYNAAEKIGDNYTRTGHGYWTSAKEMAARAFACYVKDKLAEQGYKNDYLCGHAENMAGGVATYPMDEERQQINQAFDALFAKLRRTYFKG